MAASFLLLLPSCVGNDQLVRRAAFDMNCPESSLEVHDLGGRTRGVRGCGQQATYVLVCREPGYGDECARGDWVMNNDTSGGMAR